jgi:hypothetical protein
MSWACPVRVSSPRCCRIYLYENQGAGYAGADRRGFALFPRLSAGPAPLAARGLAAVLARAGPAGSGN